MSKKEVIKEIVKFTDYSLDLPKAILAVQKDGEKLRHKIHNVALSIITAWGKKAISKDEAAVYFTALGKASGYHGKALANWIALKTPLQFSDESKAWSAPIGASVNGDTFKAARDEPFWEVSPPPEAKPFDALALLEAILSKQANKMKKGISSEDKYLPAEAIVLVREAIAAMK